MTTSGLSIQVPYLPTTQNFPEDAKSLSNTLSKWATDVAQNMNTRSIGIYNMVQSATGNKYYTNQNMNPANPIEYRQSFRQVYTLAALPNSTTATIPTNIQNIAMATFVNIYGVAQSASIATALTPWVMATPNDAPYLRINISTGNIEIITTSGNWVTYAANITLEYLLN
jgi:hypothetical protein